MSFWSAQNWCASHGMHLASLSDLGLEDQPVAGCNSSRDADLDWEGLTTAFGTGYIWVKKDYEGQIPFNGVTYDGVVPMIIRVGTNNNPCVYHDTGKGKVLVICK